MYHITQTKLTMVTGAGILGAIVTELFGGWNNDIITLCIFMAVDYIFGILSGILSKSNKTKTGALSSRAAFEGACRKGVILLLVLIAHRLDLLIGTTFIRSGAIVGFCFNEAISITENAAAIGVPMPAAIKRGLDILKSKDDDNDGDGKSK